MHGISNPVTCLPESVIESVTRAAQASPRAMLMTGFAEPRLAFQQQFGDTLIIGAQYGSFVATQCMISYLIWPAALKSR